MGGRPDAAGLDHPLVGVGIEVVKDERLDAVRLERLRGAVHEARGHDPRVADEERAREAQLPRQLGETPEGARAEDNPRAWLEIEGLHPWRRQLY